MCEEMAQSGGGMLSVTAAGASWKEEEGGGLKDMAFIPRGI